MESQRYLPAVHVKAGSLRLGRLSVRTSDDHELGKLLGFVIDQNHICSLVVQSNQTTLEVPMAPVQFDAASRSLRMLQPEMFAPHEFFPESVPQVEMDDLWIPLLSTFLHPAHSAA